MIEGPLTGATDSDAASAADVTALAATVASNITAIATKAAASDLTVVEGTTATHTGQIASLNNSYNNLGNSFYTKVFTDALLAGKQTTVADGDLTIARTSGLQSALDGLATDVSLKTNSSLFTSVTNTLDGLIVANATSINANATAVAGKQDTIAGTFTPTLATFSTPVTMNSDLQCAGSSSKNLIIGATNSVSTTSGSIKCSQHLNIDTPTGAGIVSFQFFGGTGGVYFSNGAGSLIATISNTGVYNQISDDRVSNMMRQSSPMD